jgi:hypothetical protein
MHSFCPIRERVRNIEDCPLERVGFELTGDFINGQQGIRKRQRARK